MRMIDKIMRSMRDTGLLEGMSDEDADTLVTAALEALKKPTPPMMTAGADIDPRSDDSDPYSYAVAVHEVTDIFSAMIDAALNE